LGVETVAPPMSSCPRTGCNSLKLGETKSVEARLYTLHRGVLPIFSKSLYCRTCHTRYYNNYSVEQASNPSAQRQYYNHDMPRFIHVFETCFVELQLCTYFEVQMALAHVTCQGISRVYNMSLGASEIPTASQLLNELSGDLVLEAFLLHSVLRDKQERQEVLFLPHHTYQNHRLDHVLAERNLRMAGTGQEMWAHACNRCMKIYKGEDDNWYRMTAGVHDGVTVRHLCCTVHDCTEALPTQRDHFCATHRHLIKVCCIRGCQTEAEPGFRTCTVEAHRAFQTDSDVRNGAMFQLHTRLRNAGIPQVPPAGSSAEPPTTPANTGSTAAATTETPQVKGRLARNWTNNEQLFVRCCGVILSRATFFGSEGISSVATFLKTTFPAEYPGALPSYIFYDNNCQFLKHLRHVGDHYFDHVGLPVDVFHFKCKHTVRDVFCQTHCNPARFRELIGLDGSTWVFNSSAAEQANVWFGKFQSTVQDMPVLRYNFFLDEMIAIYNRFTVERLRSQGERPHLQAEELLRGPSAPL
ncbi:hypothetical protein C8J57DRAFT_1089536, partial [Mycena rebaudengoi]